MQLENANAETIAEGVIGENGQVDFGVVAPGTYLAITRLESDPNQVISAMIVQVADCIEEPAPQPQPQLHHSQSRLPIRLMKSP